MCEGCGEYTTQRSFEEGQGHFRLRIWTVWRRRQAGRAGSRKLQLGEEVGKQTWVGGIGGVPVAVGWIDGTEGRRGECTPHVLFRVVFL